MKAAFLNSAILHSAILIKTLIPTNSIWLKVIHSDWSWWRQPSWIQPFCTKETSLIDSDTMWWRQPYWILPSWIHPFCTKKTHSFILTQLDDGSHLEFCQLNFHHLGFSHNSFSSQSHSHLPILVPTICTKKTSLIHSDSAWWWQPSWILPWWIQTLPFWIHTPCFLLSGFTQKHSLSTLTLTQTNSIWLTRWWQPSWILPFWIQPFCTKLWLNLIQTDSNSFPLTELDDGSHLEFCHLGFSHLHKETSPTHSHSNWWWQPSRILPSRIEPFCTKKNLTHSFWLNLMMAAILNSAMLDSDTAILDSNTLLSSLRFTQKHSSSTLTLTPTNSIWLT